MSMQDITQKILRTMVTHGENRFCFDCNQRSPTYVNMTIGSFVCTNCGGALRKYNHRVKSISMSNFSQADIEFLCTRGNKLCRRIYLALSDERDFVEKDLKDEVLDIYLRQKYQTKKWYRDPPRQLEAEILKENKELVEQAERNASHKNTKTGGNTAAGLIVLPTRSGVVPTTQKLVSTSTSTTSGKSESLSKVNAMNGQTQTSQAPADPFSSSQSENFANFATITSSSDRSTAQIPTDPFASFISQPFPTPTHFPGVADMTNTTKQQDFFSSYSPQPTTNPQTRVQAPTFQTTSNPIPWISASTSAPTHTPINNIPNSTGDKYAALAELDGLFKSATITSTTSSSNADRTGIAAMRANATTASININPWSTTYGLAGAPISGPLIATTTVATANQVTPNNLWPQTPAVQKDNTRPSNPFAAPVSDPAASFRFSNPFAQYTPYTTASTTTATSYLPNSVGFDNSMRMPSPIQSKNPFATQTNRANPFSTTTNPNLMMTNSQPITFNPGTNHNNLFGVNGTSDNFGLFNIPSNPNLGPASSSLSNFSPF